MEKKIYLPHYAKNQLETSDDSRVWSRPIPFREKPEEGFMFEAILGEGTLEIDVNSILEDGLYHPDMDQDLEATIESIQKVRASAIKKEVLSPARIAYPNAIYRRFSGPGGDSECWARYVDGNISVISNKVYHFTGFGAPSEFHLDQEKSLDKVLAEGAGIIINRKELKLCDESYKSFSPKSPKFAYRPSDRQSLDGNTYKLFQDYDDGAKGWAIFTEKNKTKVLVLMEDHNCNVRDWMLSDEFLKQMGFKLNLKTLWRLNHNFYEQEYVPNRKDFLKDYHVDEKGKIKKA